MLNPFHNTSIMPYLLFFLVFFSQTLCIAQEINRDNLVGEYITYSGEKLFTPPTALERTRRPYPWMGKEAGGIFRVTKDFFRCKGDASHPLITEVSDGNKKVFIRDCQGGEKHGLPVRDSKEFIYPCLIDLLNYVQDKTKKKVVITAGHYCPTHNHYVDRSSASRSSRHMIGAEVDFYVSGMEREAEKIIGLLLNYYKENFKENDYITFQRMDASKHNLTVSPWYNKEILIKLNLPHENRDFDNSHSYPYITIQVRYDRNSQSKVVFEEKMIYQYLRN